MKDLLLYCVIIVLKNAAVFICFQEGMIFGGIRTAGANFFDKHFPAATSKYIQKPLWDCLQCMSSVWTMFWLLLYGVYNPRFWFECILVVCGMSIILSFFIQQTDD